MGFPEDCNADLLAPLLSHQGGLPVEAGWGQLQPIAALFFEYAPVACDPSTVQGAVYIDKGVPNPALLLAMVPWVHLHTWHGTLSFEGVGGKPRLLHNLYHHLEEYLWLLPTAKEYITTSIAMFLSM